MITSEPLRHSSEAKTPLITLGFGGWRVYSLKLTTSAQNFIARPRGSLSIRPGSAQERVRGSGTLTLLDPAHRAPAPCFQRLMSQSARIAFLLNKTHHPAHAESAKTSIYV